MQGMGINDKISTGNMRIVNFLSVGYKIKKPEPPKVY
jgi:hypothetical protein